MEEKKMIRILCISDTHSYFDPALKKALKSADHIFHTGDIGDLSIINELESFTKTHVVSGNIDGFTRSGYPIFYRTEIQNHRFLLTQKAQTRRLPV